MNWTALSGELDSLLKLQSSPLAITFSAEAPAGVNAFDTPMAEPTASRGTRSRLLQPRPSRLCVLDRSRGPHLHN